MYYSFFFNFEEKRREDNSKPQFFMKNKKQLYRILVFFKRNFRHI